MACRLLNDDEDPERRALVALLDGWARLAPSDGLTARSAIMVLYTARHDDDPPDGFDDLREAIEHFVTTMPGRPPCSKKLGYTLRKFKRRVIGGRLLDVTPNEGHGGTNKWRVIEGGKS
jgi:hypothetical protein